MVYVRGFGRPDAFTISGIMDIARKPDPHKKLKRLLLGGVGLLLILGISLGLSKLKPAAPEVDRSTVWVDTVKRGNMLRQVRGLGTLVPDEKGLRFISAVTEGRVDRILVLPGAQVKANTVLLDMTNPQLEQQALDARWQLKAAEAEYRNLEVQLQSQLLAQKADAAKVASDYGQAKRQADTDEQLAKLGVISDINLNASTSRANELANRNQIEEKRLDISTKGLQSQLAASQAKVEQLRALAGLKQSQMDALRVRAGIDGVLQELPLRVGQWVTAGTTLAKVVQPDRLKAELRIPETQAKDIQLGQPASVDTHNGVIAGHVTRIDPAVQNGTVTVDAALDGPLPQGARPDLSVDGTVDLERLNNILYVGRPAFGQENSTVGIFRLEPDGKTAVRVQGKLGRSSVNTIEILGGLKEGDQVILSDMSRWDTNDRIRLD